jgi:hypothetical protein
MPSRGKKVLIVRCTVALNLHRPCLVVDESSPFPLPGTVSPPVNIATPPRRAVLHSHRAKMSSLTPLHITATLRPIASPLKSKLKY